MHFLFRIRFFFCLPLLLLGADAGAQMVEGQAARPCPLTITGRLLSEHDAEPLAYAAVFSPAAEKGTLADESGNFTLTGLCPGDQSLTFTHVGCDNETLLLTLGADTTITVYLHHHDNYTETVVVTGQQNVSYDDDLDELATEELAGALNRITGVSSLKAGTSAAKPVVDGVFGNRLSIQNNGIAQSGQQWGNDHAPEIDPWVAAYVRVVDGVEALKYAGSTVAATVLIEPAPLREEELAAGKAGYTFRTNGRGHQLNLRTSKGGRLAHRISLSGKYAGDQRAPDYLLANTGRREGNAAVQLAYFHNDKLTTRAYYSIFNTSVGVLRGSHIGNLTDLNDAITRPVPFFTTDTFTYRIDPPRQAVTHHLAKLETEYKPNDRHRLTFRYGGQLNQRKEFDVRRGGRSDRPALSLEQYNHLAEGAWHHELGPDRHLDANVQLELTYNDNVPGTGILPLIPDYNANRVSGYLAYHHERERFQYHAGVRYDRQFFEAITINRVERVIERFEHVFNSFGSSVEGRYQLAESLSLRGGLTYRERAPQINELYANGLHQGVSGIEEGDRTLNPEKSLKITSGLFFGGTRWTMSAGVFVQPIQDYIFLEPQAEPVWTTRGAFPYFLYRAGDALLYGSNVRATYLFGQKWEADVRLALVRGDNRTEGRPLVFMPTDNARLGLTYRPATGWEIGAEALFVARQNRLEEDQDFLDPPPGYSLFQLELERELPLPNNRSLHLRAVAQNLFNTSYRDYLDRQRYFTDATGRNVQLGITYSW